MKYEKVKIIYPSNSDIVLSSYAMKYEKVKISSIGDMSQGGS